MRDPLSKQIREIKPSGIRKFFDVVNEMPDAISLGVGEPDFDTPWHIRDEGIYSLEKGRTFYTSNSGLKELKEEICNYLKRSQGLEYDYRHQVIVTVGGSEAIDIALRAMLDPGDEVLIPQPCYVSYDPCTILAGGVPVPINLKHENEFRLTAQELRDAITPKTKVLIMPFPNNPTGAIMEKEDLEAIAEVIIEHDLYVISDEIYAELTYKDKHVSIATLEGLKERTILINGFSKAYAMTGWRLGYVAARQDIIKGIMRFQSQVNSSNCSISQKAGVAALTGPQDSIAAMVEEFARRKDYVYDRVCKIPHMSCPEPKGAFYVLCDISYYFGKSYGEWHINNGHDLSEYLLVTQQVSTVPGEAYYLPGTIRFAYANSMENLKIALDRVEDALAKLQ